VVQTRTAATMPRGNLTFIVHYAAMKEWDAFLDRCLNRRLDVEPFESMARRLNSKRRLPSDVLADLLLRPRAKNRFCLDPRIPLYLQAMTKLGYVKAPSVLKALYRYSTSHTQAGTAAGNGLDGDGDTEMGHKSHKKNRDKNLVRWQSSYGMDEVIFYRLMKAVMSGEAIQNGTDATKMMELMAQWMTLFTAASAAFAQDLMGQLDNSMARVEMESARAAFLRLLLQFYENPVVLKVMGKPYAKSKPRCFRRGDRQLTQSRSKKGYVGMPSSLCLDSAAAGCFSCPPAGHASVAHGLIRPHREG
jgi:mediator of RNA polymerase II transcription subunit 5